MLQVLRHRQFRRVWLGESVSIIGDLSFETVFIWLVLDSTGSPAALSLVMLAQAVPRGLFLLLGGAVTDRVSPRTVMLGSHLVRGVAVGLLAVGGTGRLWHLVALGIVMGTAEAFFQPASDSILPSLLPDEDLARGNALTGFSEQLARLAGPTIGGVLAATVGTGWACVLNAVSFFVAAATLYGTPRSAPPAPTNVLKHITEGLRYAHGSRPVRTVLLVVAASTLTYSGLFSVGLPALAQQSHGSIALGLLLSSWGLGQLIGTVAAAVTGLPRHWGRLIIVMAFCEGIGFLSLGLVPSLWLAVPVLAGLGIGVAYSSDVALPTFVQTTTPRDVLGRVSSVMSLPRVVLEPVSIAALGLLISHDLRWGLAVAALPMLLVGTRLALDPQARALSTPG